MRPSVPTKATSAVKPHRRTRKLYRGSVFPGEKSRPTISSWSCFSLSALPPVNFLLFPPSDKFDGILYPGKGAIARVQPLMISDPRSIRWRYDDDERTRAYKKAAKTARGVYRGRRWWTGEGRDGGAQRRTELSRVPDATSALKRRNTTHKISIYMLESARKGDGG